MLITVTVRFRRLPLVVVELLAKRTSTSLVSSTRTTQWSLLPPAAVSTESTTSWAGGSPGEVTGPTRSGC